MRATRVIISVIFFLVFHNLSLAFQNTLLMQAPEQSSPMELFLRDQPIKSFLTNRRLCASTDLDFEAEVSLGSLIKPSDSELTVSPFLQSDNTDFLTNSLPEQLDDPVLQALTLPMQSDNSEFNTILPPMQRDNPDFHTVSLPIQFDNSASQASSPSMHSDSSEFTTISFPQEFDNSDLHAILLPDNSEFLTISPPTSDNLYFNNCSVPVHSENSDFGTDLPTISKQQIQSNSESHTALPRKPIRKSAFQGNSRRMQKQRSKGNKSPSKAPTPPAPTLRVAGLVLGAAPLLWWLAQTSGSYTLLAQAFSGAVGGVASVGLTSPPSSESNVAEVFMTEGFLKGSSTFAYNYVFAMLSTCSAGEWNTCGLGRVALASLATGLVVAFCQGLVGKTKTGVGSQLLEGLDRAVTNISSFEAFYLSYAVLCAAFPELEGTVHGTAFSGALAGVASTVAASCVSAVKNKESTKTSCKAWFSGEKSMSEMVKSAVDTCWNSAVGTGILCASYKAVLNVLVA